MSTRPERPITFILLGLSLVFLGMGLPMRGYLAEDGFVSFALMCTGAVLGGIGVIGAGVRLGFRYAEHELRQESRMPSMRR